jgi:predicted AAA+ superfamily ATPase
MYVKRLLKSALLKALKGFPAVLITGPRQTGKTTFLRQELGEACAYVTFDDPVECELAIADPRGFLARFRSRRVILDEIQYATGLLPYLKMAIDKDEAPGSFVLTGSQQFELMAGVSESLAGRVAIFDLLPFSTLENRPEDLGAALWQGGYPKPALTPEVRDIWVRSYLRTYIERDVRLLSNVKDLQLFQTFCGLGAARHAQELNISRLAREAGVSEPTAKSWIGILETCYIMRRLRPFFKNYGKRLVRSPKLYFVDPALVCHLTRQPSAEATLAGAMGGAIFEGFIISEAAKVFAMAGKEADLFFWRTHDGLEVDLIVRIGTSLYPIEIKLTATPSLKHTEAINRFKSLTGAEAAEEGIVVCRVEDTVSLPGGNLALPWHRFPGWLQARLGL